MYTHEGLPELPVVNNIALRGTAVSADIFGDIDAFNAPYIRSFFTEHFASGCQYFTLDISLVNFMDSAGVGLISAMDKALIGKGSLVLLGVGVEVWRSLSVSGISQALSSTEIKFAAREEKHVQAKKQQSLIPLIPFETCFDVEPKLDQLRSVRAEIDKILGKTGLEYDQINDVRLAVTEALVNAILHGLSNIPNPILSVNIKADASKVVIEVCNNGESFDGIHNYEDGHLSEGGRGLMFIRELMDITTFETDDKCGTRVRMVKYARGL